MAKKIVSLFVGFIFLISLVSCGDTSESENVEPAVSEETTQSTETTEDDALDVDKAEAIVTLINDYRTENGLDPMEWSDEMANIALDVLLDYLDDKTVSEELMAGAAYGQCGPSAEADAVFQLITNVVFFSDYMGEEYLLNEDYTLCGAVFYLYDEKTAYWCLKFA